MHLYLVSGVLLVAAAVLADDNAGRTSSLFQSVGAAIDSHKGIFDAVDEHEEGVVFHVVPKKESTAMHRRELRKQRCHNGGVFKDGKCECVYPFTGATCQDYACVNGLSTGPRYDPHSLFFNRKCICNPDWDGELCDEPIADQCNDRGHYENGHCICHGFYFGPECQYVSRCEFGNLKHGRCVCHKGWEGDYCDRIVCQHGFAGSKNGSQFCVCPVKYKGLHCESCLQVGPKIKPYPSCIVDILPASARNTREHTNTQIYARVVIISVAGLFLMGLIMLMYMMRWRRERCGTATPADRPERQEMVLYEEDDVEEGLVESKKTNVDAR